jgi:hypothetical protein
MLNEHDINDWEMITTPLKLEQLKEGEMFSFFGDDNNRLFKVMCKANQIVFAETSEIFNAFALPDFMEVYPWVINKNVNQKATDN